jgi:hypothetical protein
MVPTTAIPIPLVLILWVVSPVHVILGSPVTASHVPMSMSVVMDQITVAPIRHAQILSAALHVLALRDTAAMVSPVQMSMNAAPAIAVTPMPLVQIQLVPIHAHVLVVSQGTESPVLM